MVVAMWGKEIERKVIVMPVRARIAGEASDMPSVIEVPGVAGLLTRMTC